MNEIKKTRKHQSNMKRNKELEISCSENYSDKQPEVEEEEEDHNQTSKRSPASYEIQNYLYNYVDSSNSENDNSSNADQAGETDALANLWFKMFNLASNFQKRNDFPNKLSLFLKVNPDK